MNRLSKIRQFASYACMASGLSTVAYGIAEQCYAVQATGGGDVGATLLVATGASATLVGKLLYDSGESPSATRSTPDSEKRPGDPRPQAHDRS